MPSLFGNRKVEFRDDVSVYTFECDDTGSVSSLDTDSSDGNSCQLTTGTSKHRIALVSVSDHDDNIGRRTSDIPEKPRWNHIRSSEHTSTRKKTRSSDASSTIRFSIVDDEIKGRTLQLWIMLGTSFGPEGVMVKSNTRGDELEVLACKRKKSSSTGGIDIGTEYTASLPLPAVVDPLRLCARVDKRGCLMVEAPLLKG